MVQRPRDHLLVVLRLTREPGVEHVELARDPAALVRRLVRVGPVRREHRIERERDEQRYRDGRGDRQGERFEPLSCLAVRERDRHEHREDRERRRRHGEPDLVGAVVRRLVMIFALLHVPHDVLAHNDRVVDQNADRQRQAHERHRLELEAERPHGDEARQHGDRQRHAGDHRRAPRIEEQEDDEHRENRAEEERLLHVAHGPRDANARVLDELDLGARGQRLLDLRESSADARRDIGRAEAFRFLDIYADRFLAVV